MGSSARRGHRAGGSDRADAPARSAAAVAERDRQRGARAAGARRLARGGSQGGRAVARALRSLAVRAHPAGGAVGQAASAGTTHAGASHPTVPPAVCARTARGRSARATAPPRVRASSRETPRARSASPGVVDRAQPRQQRSRWGISAAGTLTVPASGACSRQMARAAWSCRIRWGRRPRPPRRGSARSDIPASASTGPRSVWERPVASSRGPRPAFKLARLLRWALTIPQLSLPSRALPHRFEGSAPGRINAGALSQPAIPASTPGCQIAR